MTTTINAALINRPYAIGDTGKEDFLRPSYHTNRKISGMTNYHIGPPWNSLRHLGTCYNNKNTYSQIIQAETTFL